MYSTFIIYISIFSFSSGFMWFHIVLVVLSAVVMLLSLNNLMIVLLSGPYYVKVTHLVFYVSCALLVGILCFCFACIVCC